MGVAFSLLGLPAGLVGSCAAACCSAAACSLVFKSCNCNNSVATRVAFALIFLLNSILAWVMRSNVIAKQIEKITLDYLRIDCAGEGCFGIVAVHRVEFALVMFHLLLCISLIGVHDSRDSRAAIQNGWWGPKILLWIVLLTASFFIPNEAFPVIGNYVHLAGAALFVLLGLILLIDFAHAWAETCLERWEMQERDLWKYVLIGSTILAYGVAFALIGVVIAYFASPGCTFNIVVITLLVIAILVSSIASVTPAIQNANPKSGLAQSSIVAIYCTYLTFSALANEPAEAKCNPFGAASALKGTAVVLGAILTFLAIAYSTSKAAVAGVLGMEREDEEPDIPGEETGLISASRGKRYTPVPESSERQEYDDEVSGTVYSYAFFHVVFALAAMYVAELITDWAIIDLSGNSDIPSGELMRIGQSMAAVWVKIVSSWLCFALYIWTLVAPLVLPDRF